MKDLERLDSLYKCVTRKAYLCCTSRAHKRTVPEVGLWTRKPDRDNTALRTRRHEIILSCSGRPDYRDFRQRLRCSIPCSARRSRKGRDADCRDPRQGSRHSILKSVEYARSRQESRRQALRHSTEIETLDPRILLRRITPGASVDCRYIRQRPRHWILWCIRHCACHANSAGSKPRVSQKRSDPGYSDSQMERTGPSELFARRVVDLGLAGSGVADLVTIWAYIRELYGFPRELAHGQFVELQWGSSSNMLWAILPTIVNPRSANSTAVLWNATQDKKIRRRAHLPCVYRLAGGWPDGPDGCSPEVMHYSGCIVID